MSERDLIERLRAHDMNITPDWHGPEGALEQAKWCDTADELIREAATTIASLSEALAEAEKKGAETRAERDGVLYAFHHRLFSEVGLSYPNDGVSVCTGLKLDALAAAKTLREMGLVTIRNSGAGPLVTWADGRGLPAPPRDLSQGGQHG